MPITQSRMLSLLAIAQGAQETLRAFRQNAQGLFDAADRGDLEWRDCATRLWHLSQVVSLDASAQATLAREQEHFRHAKVYNERNRLRQRRKRGLADDTPGENLGPQAGTEGLTLHDDDL